MLNVDILIYNTPTLLLKLHFECRTCSCNGACLSLIILKKKLCIISHSSIVWLGILFSPPSLVSDPTVSRYHVQWMPEYCSHNETRGPEKSVTQVSSQPFLTEAPVRERSAENYDLISSSALCKARSWPFVWCLKRTAPPKKTSPPSWPEGLLCWVCTVQITGCCSEYYESVIMVRLVACWPIKHIYLNNVSRNGVHSPPVASAMLLHEALFGDAEVFL